MTGKIKKIKLRRYSRDELQRRIFEVETDEEEENVTEEEEEEEREEMTLNVFFGIGLADT